MTANYFDVLGVQPIRGRTFLPNEEEGADVAVVSENFWKTDWAATRMWSDAPSLSMAWRTPSSA